MFEHFTFFVDAQGHTNVITAKQGSTLVEITSSFRVLRASSRSHREDVLPEDVTWNWYYYHQLIVIVLRAVKGTLRGSVKVPGGKVNLYRKHLPIRKAIPREKWWYENSCKILQCDSAISINISISISIRESLTYNIGLSFIRISVLRVSKEKINTFTDK